MTRRAGGLDVTPPAPSGPLAARHDTWLARWWRAVPLTAWIGGALAVVIGGVLHPSLAARYLSSDGILAPASRRRLAMAQLLLLVVGALLVLAGRALRHHTARKERLVLGALFSCGAILGSLVLCEAGLWAASGVRPLRADRHFFFVHDEVLGWRHRPGAVAVFKRALVKINSAGLRDDEITAVPAAGELRLMFLGDSQVFGDGVAADETFVQRLERDAAGVQAVNGGVIGYGTDQQLLYFERAGEAFAPQITIVGLNAYDLRDNISDRVRSGYQKPRFDVAGGRLELFNVPISKGSIVDRAQRQLRSRSHLYTLLSGMLADPGARAALAQEPAAEVFPPATRWPQALRVTEALLERLAARVRLKGGTLVVAFLPYAMDFGDDAIYRGYSDRLVAAIDSCAHRGGFTAIDLRAQLQSGTRLYLDTMHFNVEGHRRVAAALRTRLTELGLMSLPHGR